MTLITKITMLALGIILMAACVDDSRTYQTPGHYYSAQSHNTYQGPSYQDHYPADSRYYSSQNRVRSNYAPVPNNNGYSTNHSRISSTVSRDADDDYSNSQITSSTGSSR
ncbi:MAG: hypothetical protein A3F11_10385 [Gammaproteobacteria bacterium RIFCSPHIGHO2_12_FULL_37_14]|nr:MAG: hypothetical protein A3F11_10385 [Gammaproteobacteria bacterium RIFCSPHIGHO2_12_FULL_37_14]